MSRKKRGLLGRKRSARSVVSTPPGEVSPQEALVGVSTTQQDVSAGAPVDLHPEDAPSPPVLAPEPDPVPEPVPAAVVDSAPEPLVVLQADLKPAEPVAPTIVPHLHDPTSVPDPLAPNAEPTRPPTSIPEPPTSEHVHLQAGDMMGQWIIDSDIGTLQGCRLFRAHHKDTQRIRVVLKVLCPVLGHNPNLVREGELLFALKHPNVASVRNLKLTHVPPYLEMDELPGDRLDHMLATSQIFMAQALDLVEQLLGALVYLHARDIFHRDIQPANVMVRQNGVLTLMGFAHTLDPSHPTPPPLSALGYLPPEWPSLDGPAQADLYAAGCLLYELLTGRCPFDAPVDGGPLTVATVLHKKKALPYLDPGDRFQEDLRAVVRMLTSNESRGRFPSAATALGRLQRVERSYAT